MKKLIYGTIILVLLGIVSCKKEEIATETYLSDANYTEFKATVNSKINYSTIKLVNKGFKGDRSSTTILAFADMESFTSTLTELENERNTLDSLFIDFYNYLDEDEINAKEEEIGFDERTPFFTFENSLGFYSLFHQIEDEMDIFLQQENPDWENSPNDHFIGDKVVRVLLNPDAEVIIGNAIYKFYQDGTYCEIQDQNLGALKQIDGRDISCLTNESGIFIHGSNNSSDRSDDCKSNRSNHGELSDGSFRIKWKIQFYRYPWETGMKSCVDSYKWHGGALKKWKSHRTYLKVGVRGSFCQGNAAYNNGLTDPIEWVYSDRSNKKSWEVKIFTTTYNSTKSEAVFGYHYGNGLTHNSTLTF